MEWHYFGEAAADEGKEAVLAEIRGYMQDGETFEDVRPRLPKHLQGFLTRLAEEEGDT